MRRYAFALTILLLSILLAIFIFAKPVQISSPQDLESLQENQKVSAQGLVISEKIHSNHKIITLDNSLTLLCSLPCPTYLNKKIQIFGTLENFPEKNTIKILKITLSKI